MKQVFVIFHLLLLTVAASESVTLLYRQWFPQALPLTRPLLSRPASEPGKVTGSRAVAGPEKYETITRRNLFDVLVRKSSPVKTSDLPAAQKEPEPEKNLELVLWGTITSASGEGNFAVIEAPKEKKQSLFQKGDSVEGAVIRKIERSRVILEINGQEQVLEVDTTRQASTGNGQPPLLPVTSYPDPAEEAGPVPSGNAPGELDTASMMKQVRIRPYVSSPDGGAGGLLLYAVRKDSMVEQLGLRNGDIIQSVNDTPTRSGQDMEILYSALADSFTSPSDSRFAILRQGEAKEIIYNPRDNTYTVTPGSDKTAPEEKP